MHTFNNVCLSHDLFCCAQSLTEELNWIIIPYNYRTIICGINSKKFVIIIIIDIATV
jgi:hypothetical protein